MSNSSLKKESRGAIQLIDVDKGFHMFPNDVSPKVKAIAFFLELCTQSCWRGAPDRLWLLAAQFVRVFPITGYSSGLRGPSPLGFKPLRKGLGLSPGA